MPWKEPPGLEDACVAFGNAKGVSICNVPGYATAHSGATIWGRLGPIDLLAVLIHPPARFGRRV